MKELSEFAEYIEVHSLITYDDAKRLFPICNMLEIKKEEVVEDLILNNGDWFTLRREYLLGGGR